MEAAGGGGGAGLGMFVFDGCISCHHSEITRRPYHSNCGCALHRRHPSTTGTNCSNLSVSFPIQRSPSQGSLTLAASSASINTTTTTSTSSPHHHHSRSTSLPSLWDFDD